MAPRRALLCLLALGAGACALLPRRLELPPGDGAAVMVMTNRLGGPIRRIARHAYIAARADGAAEWEIFECCPPSRHYTREPFTPSFGDEVLLHGVWRGAEAARALACLPGAHERYGRPRYWPVPGPNSNTYADSLMRGCGLDAELPGTAVGKDWRGWLGVSRTAGRTGVQLETPIAGLKVGLSEGVEVHILGLSLGIDLWPPALIVPVGDGRLGFADR